MDGGRRLLQSVTRGLSGILPRAGARAGQAAVSNGSSIAGHASAKAPPARPRKPAPRPRSRRPGPWERFTALVTRRGFGTALAIGLLTATGVYGSVRGGVYDKMVEEFGTPANMLAKAAGFGIDVVTITGQKELVHHEILAASGITARDSLALLDVAAVRERLRKVPLIADANVRKLYPNQVVISVTERKAHALWQMNGNVSVIAADGKVIDKLRDQRFNKLPFVVGEGANLAVGEYQAIVAASGPLRYRIRAGTLINGRRWNLKLKNGMDIKLPEVDPAGAMKRFAVLAGANDLLEKDVMYFDLRAPGKLVARLSVEAAARREGAGKKRKSRGGGA